MSVSVWALRSLKMPDSGKNSVNLGQMTAIKHENGALLVLAGPGSGKTYTIIQRILHLIEKSNVDPASILVITFTKAAAREMKQRFRQKTAGRAWPVNFGTFHAVYYHILKTSCHYRSDNIISDYEKRELLKTILQRPGFTCTDEEETIDSLLGEISRFKNDGCPPENRDPECGLISREEFDRLYRSYDEALRREEKLDFDDMVLRCRDLLVSRPDVRKAWQQKFRYILVDEFQDINPMQYEVLRLLAQPENNLFIVGDDDQSIYAFRGARPEIMLGFRQDYPQAGIVELTQNYRSTPEIVTAAGRLIAANKSRFIKKAQAVSPSGEPVLYRGYSTRDEENESIATEIARFPEDFNETAVIYRTNQDAAAMAEKLTEKGIPFRMKEKLKSPYRQMAAQDVLSYLSFALEGRKRKDFYRIMNRPSRYISRSAVNGETVDFEELFDFYAEKPYMREILRKFQMDLERLKRMDLYAAVNYIRRGMGYDEYLVRTAAEKGTDKNELLKEAEWFQKQVRQFRSLEQLKEHIALYEKELEKAGRDPDSREGVSLLTMHASKGLEFDTVYIPDCNEGIIPHRKSMKDEAVEEERRMLYVAMTRARKRLTLTYVAGTKEEPGFLSRFLTDLVRQSVLQ